MFERFDEASLTSLNFFGGLLSRSSWNVCIIALTKANLYPPTVDEADNPANAMIAIQEAMKKEMQEKYFEPNGLLKESKEIPFVPVGYKTDMKNKSKLPCCEDSIKNFQEKCIRRCSTDSALILAATFSKHKIAVGVGIAGTSLAAGGIGAAVGGLLTFYIGGVGAIPGALVGGAVGLAGAPAAMAVKAAIQLVTERVGRAAEEKYATFKQK